jgi:two-component system, OmpR family, KDP operon response regulator KdpE
MTIAMHRVVVVEHDAALQCVLRTLLEERGFRVVLADTYARAELDARSYRPDVIIADLGLTDQRGINFIRRLRVWSAIPIIALSGRATEAQRLAAFDAGADDYVEVPFSAPELVARTRAIRRRYARGDLAQAMLKLGDVCVDLERRLARHRDGRKLRLTPLEHRMLEIFARNPDRMITHKQLMSEVWGPHKADVCAVRVYIASLRRKLEQNPRFPKHIVTEMGTGYRLVVEANTVDGAITS